MAETERLSLADARAVIAGAFTAIGVPAATAQSVAQALVAAEAEGQVGHGFSRVADYAAQVKSGKVNAGAVPALSAPTPAALVIDACDGFAYPALDLAHSALIEAAGAYGTATAAIRRSHHCGALSVQVDRIARAGFVGLMVANAPAAIAPWGAKTAVFGTNPIAFSAPRAYQPPLVIDLSLSRVARGKVMHARKSGTQIPEGWALDASGAPTTDPEAALAGTMVPIGEAKGTALALMVEILAAVATGAHTSREMSSFFTADGPPTGAGQFLMALKPASDGFAQRLEGLLGAIEALEGARLPGARRAAAIAVAEADGIKVSKAYLEAARAMAAG
ncbi:MAG: Ldh family oxidoreductase [Pseudomonadota bacterium]